MSATSGTRSAARATAACSVRGLAHDLDVVLGVEQGAEAAADQRLVVGEQDPDHEAALVPFPLAGSSARTVKPPSGRGSARKRPPRA